MKDVSAMWRQAIYAKTRQTKVTITFPFVDPDAKDAAEIQSTPAPSAISNAGQIIDDNYELVGKVAQFEPDYWTLDGSFILPLAQPNTLSQYGYWSQILSDTSGNYPANTTMRLYFSRPITVPGMTLLFDAYTDNYTTDFDCIAYDQNMTVLRKEEIRGNTQIRYVLDKGVVALKYIDIIFLKSSLPQRRIRLLEIDFGIMLIFEGSNLLSSSLISEVNHLAESIPSNELNFSALNEGKFDYTNPESYSKYLQRRQQFEYRHTLLLENGKQETVDMGVYSLQSWKVSDTKIDIKATLDLAALEEHPFRRYSLTEHLTCGVLLERIFEDCSWTDYEIEEYLYNSPLLIPYTGEVSNKEALRDVAQLAGAVVYKMPSGKIVVKRLSFDLPSLVDAIDYDNSLSSTEANSSKYYNAINLTVTAASQKETPQGNPIALYKGKASTPGVLEHVVVPYDYILHDTAPGIFAVGAQIIGIPAFYANYAFVQLKAQGDYTITITGKTVDFNSSADIVYYAPWFQEGEELHTYKLKLPMMIQGEQYQALRDWCVTERFRVLGYRLTTQSTWRQNPALDIGDYVNVQMDKSEERVPIATVKHTISYTGGALKGTTTGVGEGQLVTNTYGG